MQHVVETTKRSTLTKADVVDSVFEQVGCSKVEAGDMVDAVFEAINATLAGGEIVKVSGFGKFTVRDKKPRPGRNPLTGDAITIAARRVVTFKTSATMRERING
ncbi:MAG: integration host factor subunit alpha [Myxococcales bacterium]|nr:integration host factor subunit alpha [Myxococcales bacterium]